MFAINDGCDQLEDIYDRAWINEYYVDGQFGIQKHEDSIRGKITAKANFSIIFLLKKWREIKQNKVYISN